MDEHSGLRWSKHITAIKWLHHILVGGIVLLTLGLLAAYYYVYS